MSQWYAKTPGQVLSELDVRQSSGLSPRQAEQRLAWGTHGKEQRTMFLQRTQGSR